jgi:hypothetical protein
MSRQPEILNQFIRFLQSELAIPKDFIAIARRTGEQDPNRLSLILWQYGLINLQQLDLVFDWLETF